VDRPFSPSIVKERNQLTRRVAVVHVGASCRSGASDRAVVEEPLQIRLDGVAFAVVMRTPGADRDLTAGFLFAERVIRSREDVAELRVRGGPPAGEAHNIVDVRLSASAPKPAAAPRRVTSNASCGVCGRQSIDAMTEGVPPVAARWTLSAATLGTLPDRLRAQQAAFDETGGLHAAGLFAPDGELASVAEDVGRHNAVDKVVGRALLDGRVPLSDRVLLVSGRVSFEIVQKALLGGMPIVAAVSAPSTLAIDLAREAGITLVGFLRDGRGNVYTHPDRIAAA
jgi:FdhD protein